MRSNKEISFILHTKEYEPASDRIMTCQELASPRATPVSRRTVRPDQMAAQKFAGSGCDVNFISKTKNKGKGKTYM